MEKNKNEFDGGKKRVNGLTVALCVIAAVLMILVVVMMVMLLGRQPELPEPTVPPTEAPTVPVTEAPTEPEETEPEMLAALAELYEQNPDTAGWIKIGDTKLDYPVMYTPDEPQKYLRKDFEGKKDNSGLPFLNVDCQLGEEESTNLIVYGHNMRNGTAFRTLHSYADQKFWEENPIIEFSTLYEEREYEIFAVFYDTVYYPEDDCFKYYDFIDPETEEEFNEGIAYFQEHSLYDTEIDVEYGDSLIMLITCSYHTEHGRLVVVGRMENPDADLTVEAPV